MERTTGRRVHRRHCLTNAGDKLESVPGIRRSRRCNTFSCDFQWMPAKWEHCTHSCGLNGRSIRQIFCVPKATVDSNPPADQLWRYMVDPRKCSGGQKPTKMRHCNRIPCPANWTPESWTNCSSQCGVGRQRRQFRCHSEEVFYECGLEPIEERQCENYDNCPSKDICKGDESPLCADKNLLRYCIHPDYRRRCCQSCKMHKK